jgi:hypothetical protein
MTAGQTMEGGVGRNRQEFYKEIVGDVEKVSLIY